MIINQQKKTQSLSTPYLNLIPPTIIYQKITTIYQTIQKSLTTNYIKQQQKTTN